MKKIYSLEVTLSLCLSLFFPSCALHAKARIVQRSVANADIPYQTYRDFATNKGAFYPGARDVAIYNKYGQTVGLLNQAPMPDFSSVNNRSGIATLIHPQYATTVHHNPTSYLSTLEFGHYPYELADRESIRLKDFSVIRLNKVVTEVAPAAIAPLNMPLKTLHDEARFRLFYRMGSGRQKVSDASGKRSDIQGAYRFLTGGTIGQPRINRYQLLVINSGDVFDPKNGPLASHGALGDSGSPLYAWDRLNNQWIVVGSLSMLYLGPIEQTAYTFVDPQFIQQTRDKYASAAIENRQRNALFIWRYDAATGAGTLTQGRSTYAMQGKGPEGTSSGNDLVFRGANAVLMLQDSVDQGAGSLTFYGNASVSPMEAQTWIGGGVNVAAGATVKWLVNGTEGDNLHKVGKGTLSVNALGINPGGLSIGDGTVVLAQRPDAQGRVKACSLLRIVSGRPLVVLRDGQQVDPDSITWGFRGGRLDVNGNALTFHQLNAEDYGAALINRAGKRADIHLRYQRAIDSIPVYEWSYSRTGQVGELYGYRNSNTGTNDYFILKTPEYDWFPDNQHSNEHWEFVGHDHQQAIRTRYERLKDEDYMYHGQLRGNLNFTNRVAPGTRGALILDGAVDIAGDFTQQYGRLVFQGHPVIHAYNTPEIVEKLRSLRDFSLRSEPVSFTQPDWERRIFHVNRLVLDYASFDLARNASLTGNIEARGSAITLGSATPYIDINDGNGVVNVPRQGSSTGALDEELSRFWGHINLSAHSTLAIREKFTGTVYGQDSQVTVSSRDATLDGFSQFSQTPLTLLENARLTATGGWSSDATVSVGPSASLLLAANPVAPGRVTPTLYALKSSATYELNDESTLNVAPFASLWGHIHAVGEAFIRFGESDVPRLVQGGTPGQKGSVARLFGFQSSWIGSLSAPRARLSLNATRWQLRRDSGVGRLSASRSLVGLSAGRHRFNTLRIGELEASDTGFALRTDLQSSDKIVISQRAAGGNNVLFLDVLKLSRRLQGLHLPLITAPRGTPASLFTAAKAVRGFSKLEPIIKRQEDALNTQWVLTGFRQTPDPAAVAKARRFFAMSYKRFITEVNSLNKRAVQLREKGGRAGAWAFTQRHNGTGKGGVSHHDAMTWSGIDRKSALPGADLYSGIYMSYATQQLSGESMQGSSRDFGAGYYATLLSKSGLYLDAGVKYVHSFNHDWLAFSGLNARDYRTNSWLGGVEAGYHYPLTRHAYIEPQAQVVLGKLSGATFHWHDRGLPLSLHRQSAIPWVGRTGIVAGAHFCDDDRAITLRAGWHYETELRADGDIILHDDAGNMRVKAERDGRMHYHASIDGQVSDNLHMELDVAHSRFGNMDAEQAINAQVHYYF